MDCSARRGKIGQLQGNGIFQEWSKGIFIYAFAKSDKENIRKGELRVFKQRAKDAFSMSDEHIKMRLKKATLIEVL